MPGQYNIMYPVADLNAMKLNLVAKVTKRIARKKGQHQNSPSHSDLYTDENPKGTIHGLKFATVQDAKDSVKKIENSGKSHAHKIQAAIAMEQRARVMGKTAEAGIYRAYIEKMKKITKQKNEDTEDEKLQKAINVATAKMNLAKRVNQLRKRQKSQLSRTTGDDRKKALKKQHDTQIKNIKTSGQSQIKQMQNSFLEDFTQRDVDDLEKFADRILKKYDIDVEFTRHFVDRLNDPRNSPEIKVAELQKFFKKIQRNKGRNIRNNPDVEAVLKDMSTNLNLPVVIKTRGDEFIVTNKTIMRKKDFKTTSKVINYEKKWSDKYKSSIDCNNPKGFSQRAHCQGRKK